MGWPDLRRHGVQTNSLGFDPVCDDLNPSSDLHFDLRQTWRSNVRQRAAETPRFLTLPHATCFLIFNHAPHTRPFPTSAPAYEQQISAPVRWNEQALATFGYRRASRSCGVAVFDSQASQNNGPIGPRRDPASEKLITQLTQADPLHRAHERPACGVERFDHLALPAGFRNDAHDARPVA
jgi:hypothetical protein